MHYEMLPGISSLLILVHDIANQSHNLIFLNDDPSRNLPNRSAAPDQSLPLTFLDTVWLHFHPIRRLLFYSIPCSKAYFLDTLIPELKQSLSLSLKHFFPLAGRILYPLNPEQKPVITYRAGDSVSVTISESCEDFDEFVGNHPRDADKFYDLIPVLHQNTEKPDRKVLEVLAVKITLFPDRGVCIGFSNHHSVGDAVSIGGFINCWASINKIGGKEEGLSIESLPVFDRSVIEYDPELDSVIWNQMKESPTPSLSFPFPLPTNRVRATYVFTPSELNKLKNLVRIRIPGLVHVSSFVVTAAYVWTCLAKSLEEDTIVDNDESEFFLFVVDLRARISPPVRENYFGNCVTYRLLRIRHQELVKDEGFFSAAEAIAVEIKNNVVDNEKILEGAEKWRPKLRAGLPKDRPIFAVSGSARVDLYGADFGWGNARKMEMLSIDEEKYSMSLCKSRDYEGGLEVGILSMSKVKMDAFSAHFCDGVKRE